MLVVLVLGNEKISLDLREVFYDCMYHSQAKSLAVIHQPKETYFSLLIITAIIYLFIIKIVQKYTIKSNYTIRTLLYRCDSNYCMYVDTDNKC